MPPRDGDQAGCETVYDKQCFTECIPGKTYCKTVRSPGCWVCDPCTGKRSWVCGEKQTVTCKKPDRTVSHTVKVPRTVTREVQTCRLVKECHTEQVPCTVTRMVKECHTKQIPYTVCKMVRECKTVQDTVRTCHMVKECHTKQVPYTVCKMVPECKTVQQKTIRTCHMVKECHTATGSLHGLQMFVSARRFRKLSAPATW